jgi:hypothetical protein
MDQPKSQVTGIIPAFVLAILFGVLILALTVLKIDPAQAQTTQSASGKSASKASGTSPAQSTNTSAATADKTATGKASQNSSLNTGPNAEVRQPIQLTPAIQTRVPIQPRT